MNKCKKGFTLIELVIVIGLIAILILYIVPTFIGVIDEKKISEAEAGVALLKVALDSYGRNYNSYPANLGGLTLAQLKILELLPTDPYQTSGDNYGYSLGVAVPGLTYYAVFSRGPNNITEWSLLNSEVRKFSGDDLVLSNLPVLR